jgi:hypothetical protein
MMPVGTMPRSAFWTPFALLAGLTGASDPRAPDALFCIILFDLALLTPRKCMLDLLVSVSRIR